MEHIKTSPKDFFLYLLSNVALYYCAGWLVSLLYDCINYAFGSMSYYGYYDSGWLPSGMRWAIASLVIVFPVYVWVTHKLNKDLESHPEKKELRVRKWLMYLTLSLASIALVVDMVALIYQFLSGEFATTFFLKVAAVALVAGMVFGYYFYELRRDAGKPAPQRSLFRYGSLAVVIISIVLGFVIVGSPTTARERQYDERRISDLQSIQWQIVNYWQSKEQLPQSLNQLNDPISGYTLPLDPETGMSYEYTATGSAAFELCATFDQQSRDTEASMVKPTSGVTDDSWMHDTGRTCFTRTIDPQLYPPKAALPRY